MFELDTVAQPGGLNEDSSSSPSSASSTSILASSATSRTSTDSLFSFSKTPQSPYAAEAEFHAHNFMLHWFNYYTVPRSDIEPQVWTVRIPQAAFEFPSLRNLLLALGTVGSSIARGDNEEEHALALKRGARYANTAISTLASDGLPTTSMLFAAWMFWQLDLIRGNLITSPVHIISARKMAAQAPANQLDMDLLSGLFRIESPDEGFDITCCPAAFDPANSPTQRKWHATRVLRRTIHDLTDMMLAVSIAHAIPAAPAASVAAILTSTRKEAEWLLVWWSSTLASEAGTSTSTTVDAPNPEESLGPVVTKAYRKVVADDFSSESLLRFRARCRALMPQLVVLVAQRDLGLRQDGLKMMDAAPSWWDVP